MKSGGMDADFFGGADPEELAEAMGNGFACWLDTDEKDRETTKCQAAVIVDAPVDRITGFPISAILVIKALFGRSHDAILYAGISIFSK